MTRAMEGLGAGRTGGRRDETAALPGVMVFTSQDGLDFSITERLAGGLRAAADRQMLGCDWEAGTSKVGSSIA